MAVVSTGRVANAIFLLLNIGSANAFWRLECDGSVGLARMDPLMDYGRVADHVHTIKGGSAFGTTSTSADLLKSKCASCSVGQDKSAYWTPAVYFMADDGTTEIVPEKPPHKTYYFLNGGMTHDGKTQKIEAFPTGFQMISGSNYNRNTTIPDPDPNPLGPWPDDDQETRSLRALGFNCLNYARGTDEPSLSRHFMPDKSYLDANCADGIRLELMFPSCWNGELDGGKSHKSHVAFPDSVMTGNCPEGYGRRLVSLFYETIIATDAYKDKSGKFVFSNGDIKGYGYHGDFIAAWEEGVLQQAVDTCTSLSGQQRDCEIFNFPDGTAQCTLQDPLPQAISGENVKGPMQGLPNSLPIQTGPEMATKPGGSQPVATAPASVASYASTSVAKNPVVTLSSKASKAEASHTVEPNGGAVFAQMSPASTASSSATYSNPATIHNKVAPVAELPKPAATPATTSSPQIVDLAESTIDVSYTTVGREVHEMVEVMVEVTVTETAHVAKRTPHAHHKHHQHHRANARGIGGRRLQ